ncbi:MAG: hypothetical protein AB7V62_10385 [Thermoleophilia bacterium]
MHRSSRRARAALAGVIAAAAAALPAQASAALTATGTTIAARPAYDQVVVSFTGGTLTGLERQTDAIDPSPGDGRAIVRVNARGITARPGTTTAGARSARLARRPGSVLVLLDGPQGRWKFVSYAVAGSRTQLVIRLWRTTVSRQARILSDGCLRLTRWTARGVVRARGLELQPLFEHGLVLSVRAAGAGEATIGQRALTATPGRFRPDFSGYITPGRWGGSIPFALAVPVGTDPRLPAMLEAWSTSAKDGSLDCLVQTPVVLRP